MPPDHSPHKATQREDDKLKVDFSEIGRTNQLVDERGRLMRFPRRNDYVQFLTRQGLIADEREFINRTDLIVQVYSDWLRRGQVGCVFAQLLARPINREGMRTLALQQSSSLGDLSSLAKRIDAAASDAVADPNLEAISILLPTILTYESLVTLILELSVLPQWHIERSPLWRKTMVLVGLRFHMQDTVWAEILGMGPFDLFPPTRQSPITSLEIRTKPKGAIINKSNPEMRRANLDRIPSDRFLSREEHRIRFSKWTPWLRLRMLAGIGDGRAKARVTFAVPAAMWEGLKSQRRYQPEATGSEGS